MKGFRKNRSIPEILDSKTGFFFLTKQTPDTKAHFQLCSSVKGIHPGTVLLQRWNVFLDLHDCAPPIQQIQIQIFFTCDHEILQQYLHGHLFFCHFCHFAVSLPSCANTLPSLRHTNTHSCKKKPRTTARSISGSCNSHCSLLPIGFYFQEPAGATIVLSSTVTFNLQNNKQTTLVSD